MRITDEMKDCQAKVTSATDSPDNDEKHLALIHVGYKLKDFLGGMGDLLKAINACMDILELLHEKRATEQAVDAEMGVGEWEAFMPGEALE